MATTGRAGGVTTMTGAFGDLALASNLDIDA
jgi:hypothetical protein